MRLTLTKRAEYGVRMLTELALAPPGTKVTATELARTCEVPAGNVPTVVAILSRAGILMCSPGRGGGCTLSRDPSEISMIEVIQALEGPLDEDYCLLDSRRCHDKDPECALHATWKAAKATALGALADMSLGDVAARERELSALPNRGRSRGETKKSAAKPAKTAKKPPTGAAKPKAKSKSKKAAAKR